ncbi:hypothetical protein L6452_22182 [Arctium lappa]|uniref:Uncharacterized protein n=1 Tax=Arctium lappa TaxID=4217 RepID=A0ACB9B3E7_ARCLA|nr:hypothetical protein L6452_22182 [Arctium lappa]
MWMRTQLRDYGFDIEKIPILCDSKSAIAISANPVQHSKTKHIDIRYHFLKHHVEHGTIEMYFVPTDYQLFDHFTKALDEKRFTFLVSKIVLSLYDPSIVEGGARQFWLNARHAKMYKYGHYIIGYATHPSTEKILDLGINHRKLSDVFEIPTKSDLNLRKFSKEPTKEEILEFLMFIGYAVPITKRTNIRRQNLPPLWNVLFSIMNRCLTSKVGSPDQSIHTILAIMYGIYYDLPLDYVGLIFREIQNAVISKQQDQDRGTEPKNMAFGRFRGLLLGDDLIGEGKLPAEVSERERPSVRGEGSEKKKKKKSKKKRTEDVDVPKSSKKSKKATEEAAEIRNRTCRGQKKPLQKAKRALVLEESPEYKPQSLIKVASAIAREVYLHATHTSTPAVLVQTGIETGPHSPNQTLADWTEDIPSSSVPPSGETKSTTPSQKGDSVVLRVHSPEDTTLPLIENFHRCFPCGTSRIGRKSSRANISTGSEGAKDSFAKSGTFDVPEVTPDIYVTKGEFKAFADTVLQKLDELKSSVSRESQAHSEFLAEALKANTDALNALRQSSQQHSAAINELIINCAKRVDLQACGQSIIAHSNQIQALGDLCTDEFLKYVAQGVQSGVTEMTKLREEIKDITRSVMIPFHSQASTSAPDPSAFATKADLEAMGNQFLGNLNLLRSNFNEQGKKVAADLKKTIATFRFKSVVEINELSLAAEDGENLQSTQEAPITAVPLNQVPMSSEPEPHRSSKQQVSATSSTIIIQITKSPPSARDKGKAITTEPLKKIKSPPPTSEKLLKSYFDAAKSVKPEEEDWAFDLQPHSKLPILKPLDKPSKDRVAEVIQGFESLRRPFPVPPKKDIEEEM